MDSIIQYLKTTYDPLSMILYGSYSDGSNNENSDFDALVISRDHPYYHDTCKINGIPLDVFVYPVCRIEGDFSCEDFIQLLDGRVLMDTDGIGHRLKDKINAYAISLSNKTPEEIRDEIEWCKKMLLRTLRSDAEGLYRWHWVLIDSLEIFCDAVHQFYRGPKKMMRWMEREYPDAFALYQDALQNFRQDPLQRWIQYLDSLV